MEQTPVHDAHNPDLLRLIPASSRKLIEIGCSSGALAREFKRANASSNYFGVDISKDYAELAKRYCDETCSLDIEQADDLFFKRQSDRDCWIFGDTLEHLKDPWQVLKSIRAILPKDGCIVACIPNAQHWSIIAKLAIGDFRYQDSGLLDKTHLRWFTRQTIIELFADTGFDISEGLPRVFEEPAREKFLTQIGEMAKKCGANPDIAMNDALPLQYVVRAIPV